MQEEPGVELFEPEDPLPNDDTHRVTVAYRDGRAVLIMLRELTDPEISRYWTDQFWIDRGLMPPGEEG